MTDPMTTPKAESEAGSDKQRVQDMKNANWTPAVSYWRQRAEAAENANSIMQERIKQAAQMVTTAHASIGAAWVAGFNDGEAYAIACDKAYDWGDEQPNEPTPPPDAAAALQRAKDGVRAQTTDAAQDIICEQHWSKGGVSDAALEAMSERIRALRKEPHPD